jgi:uncharacterized protein (DUF362 family)/NAD-dependent dihydropyrimidine dehydrogenase PreA subunit
MKKVIVRDCVDYTPNTVEAALRNLLVPLGGMETFVKPGQTVVLKVNLLMKAKPEKCVTTNPEVVRQVGLLCQAAGAKEIIIADSPGGRDVTPEFAATAFTLSGFTAVADELGSKCVFLSDEIVQAHEPTNKLYKTFPMGALAVDADVLINLPKCKTHGMMMFTGGVKNLYGLIPGTEKAVFHARVPDSFDFADMLLDIYNTRTPELTIMDAVMGMEGEGPSGGSPRFIGALLASEQAPPLDALAERLTGFDYGETYVDHQAIERGFLPPRFEDIEIDGAWEHLVVSDYKHARIMNVGRMLPKFVQRGLKSVITPVPELIGKDRVRCSRCRTCLENCPMEAISMSPRDGRPDFDLNLCIRCYCCQELCPSHVIRLKEPWLGKILGKRK